MGERRTEYRADLDGLRALAIALVVLDHAELPFANYAGVGGVTAFFVLSGFLITTLLEAERSKTGTIAIRAFYARRVRRLGPALVVVLAFVVVMGLLGAWGTHPWVPGVLGTSAYVANWLPIAGVDLGPMAHAWSLAIEEQFYLAWPVVLSFMPRRALPTVVLGLVVAGLASRTFGSSAWMYGSTFAHADAIAVGAAVALWGDRLPAAAGWLGIAVLVVFSLLPLPLMIEPVVIATVGILLSAPRVIEPLAPIGRRAYGIYLWSWPLTLLAVNAGADAWVAIVPTIALAELSYRWVETSQVVRRHHVHRAPYGHAAA